MFLAPYLIVLAGQLPIDVHKGENPLTTLDFRQGTGALTFDWRDGTDSLRGGISPLPLRANSPFHVTASVLAQHGEDFDGPVTFSLRPLESMGSVESFTVTRAPGEKSWAVDFTPAEPGRYRIEVAWSSTHHKVLRGELVVEDSLLPRWLAWALGIAVVLLTAIVGAWVMLSKKPEAQA